MHLITKILSLYELFHSLLHAFSLPFLHIKTVTDFTFMLCYQHNHSTTHCTHIKQ